VCKELLLDVSELEAPEPLTQIIDLLNTLEQHSYLRVIHRKEPFPLYNILHKNDFDFIAIEVEPSEYNILIWNASDQITAEYCKQLKIK